MALNLSEPMRAAMAEPVLVPADFRAARIRMRHSQGYLGRLLGESEQTIRRWELGKSRIPYAAGVIVRRLLNEGSQQDAAA